MHYFLARYTYVKANGTHRLKVNSIQETGWTQGQAVSFQELKVF